MKKNNVSPIEIENKIFVLRGHKVMLDRDLAELYSVKAIRLREQLKRNKDRFPSHFMYRLTKKETELLVSQNAIPSLSALGGHLPFAFTEHGVLMLANILRSAQAIKMSVKIIEVFVKMREMIVTQKDILIKLEQLEHKVGQQSGDIENLFEAMIQLLDPQLSHERKSDLKITRNELHLQI